MQLTLVLGTALQQVTGGSYRQETLGRVPYQLYGTVRIVEGLSEEITE